MLDQTRAVSATTGRWLLVGGVVLAAAGLLSAGRRVERTRYRADRWRWPELVVVGCGIGVARLALLLAEQQGGVAFPALDTVPAVTLLALAGPLLGLMAAVAAPPPVLATAPRTGPARPVREPAVAA